MLKVTDNTLDLDLFILILSRGKRRIFHPAFIKLGDIVCSFEKALL